MHTHHYEILREFEPTDFGIDQVVVTPSGLVHHKKTNHEIPFNPFGGDFYCEKKRDCINLGRHNIIHPKDYNLLMHPNHTTVREELQPYTIKP